MTDNSLAPLGGSSPASNPNPATNDIGGGINPSWTATVPPPSSVATASTTSANPAAPAPPAVIIQPTNPVSQPLPATPSQSISPTDTNFQNEPARNVVPPPAPPSAPTVIPIIRPTAAVATPPAPSSGPLEPTKPTIPSTQQLPVETTAPELVLPPTPTVRLFPWRIVAIIVVILALIGGGIFGLWWFGIGWGAPRNAKVALTKMATALSTTTSYHTQGSLTVSYTAGQNNGTIIPSQAVLPPDLFDLFSVAKAANAALATASPTPSPSTVLPTPGVIPSPSASTIPIFPAAPTTYGLNLMFNGDISQAKTSQMTVNVDLTQLGDLLPATFPTTAQLDVRRISDQIFVRLPILSLLVGSPNNHWLAFNLQDLTSNNTSTNTISNLSLTKLGEVLANAKRVGYERLGPVKTAHYRADLAVADLARLLSVDGEVASQFSSGSKPITLDWWLGVSNHLPYQFKLTSSLVTDGTTIATTIQTNYSAYGQSVAIVAPDPVDVDENGLAGLAQVNYQTVQAKARDTARKSDLAALKSALALYRNDHGTYPTTAGATTRTNDAASPLQALVREGYIRTLPVDPLAEKNWYGYSSSDGKTYELWSVLEDSTDPQGILRDKYYLYIVKP